MTGSPGPSLQLQPIQTVLSLVDGQLFYRKGKFFMNIDGLAELAHGFGESLLRSHNIESGMSEAQFVDLQRKLLLKEASRRSGVPVEEIETKLANGEIFTYNDAEPLVRREKGR